MKLPRILVFCSLFAFASFSSLSAETPAKNPPLHVNGIVYALAAQPDGKVVVGGEFTQINGKPRNNLARLNADGSVDDSFVGQAGKGIMGIVRALAVGPDGSIVVGGSFSRADESSKMNLVRYRPDGSVDEKFPLAGTPNGSVFAVQVLADGKVVAGGEFSALLEGSASNLVIYNPDGTLAARQSALEGIVFALARSSQSLPAFVAGGNFQVPGSQTQALLEFK